MTSMAYDETSRSMLWVGTAQGDVLAFHTRTTAKHYGDDYAVD